ncbi:hypothetical protein K8R47_01715 [archaeon]|nr:hypothetical protein [archaeon]
MRFWTEYEIRTLKREYSSKGYNKFSIEFNRSPNAIRIKASRLNLNNLKLRQNIKLTKKEDQMILGGLMGDLYCRIQRTCKNANIEGAHCKKQEKYLLWKVKSLNSLSFNLRRLKEGYLFFESRVYPCLNYYYNLFYKNGKKEISKNILNKIDEFGLSIWYMDDGCYNRRGKSCNIHTNGFSYEENLIIKKWFETRWKIYPKITGIKKVDYPGKVWYFLRFNVNDTKKIIEIVKDYIHPSMRYKIGEPQMKKMGEPRRKK